MPSAFSSRPPELEVLGRDLLRVSRWRIAVSLTTPFLLAGGFFFLSALADWWLLGTACLVVLSFVTYGSISHDLVHRNLGLPRRLNDLLLTAIELLMLRSGRAYRLAHLNHHARYPAREEDDPEAAAAHGGIWQALCSGPLFCLRLWWWAMKRYPAHCPRLLMEGLLVVGLITTATAAAILGLTAIPLVYVILVYLGTWIIPLVTAKIPHDPHGETHLTQTRRFRGWIFRLIAFDHLYHLEHHLYPAVPHHHWPELARRLDRYLDAAGVPVVQPCSRSA